MARIAKMDNKRNDFKSAIFEAARDDYGDMARLYDHVFNAIPDILGILNVDHTIIRYNKAGYDFFSKTPEEIIGKRCFELIGRDIPCDVCASREVIRTGKPAHIEKYVEGFDIWFDVRAYPLHDESGKLIKIIEHLRDITTQKRAQIELKDEIAFRKAVIKSGTTGLCVCHTIPEYPFIKFTVWNDRMIEITGHTIDQINESGWFQTMHHDPERRERALKRMSEMRLGDDMISEEWNIRRSDGEDRTALISALVLDQKGDTIQIIATIVDITERKIAEKSLRDREARLSSIFRAAPAGIGLASNRVIIDVNDRVCEMTGYSREELIGRDALMLYPSREEYDQVGKDKYDQIAARGTGTVETRWKKKDGTIIDILLSSAPLDPGNFALGVTFTALDISDRKAAEKAVQDREARLSSVFRAAPVGIGLVADRIILDINNKACEITGYTREELIGQNSMMLYPSMEEFDKVGRDKYGQIARQGTGMIETRWKRKDGRIIDILLSSADLGPESLISGVMVTALDISDRKAAENKLRKALEEVQRLKNRLQDENIYLREEIQQGQNLDQIIGHSEALITIFDRIKQVAATDASVLIQGETGTGKEMIARAIHEQSHRRDHPMIRVNCASIPRELFESEFFGHVKGAFTGAMRDRVGRFQLANGGTLFLDEVGEIPLELQSKLLRVLQEGEFERVGEDSTNRVDVRIITSTNRHLEQEIVTGHFRQDLYFRLSVFPIEVPPLRERPEDIPLIAEFYLKRAYRRIGVDEQELSPENIRKLQEYWWPGNVRELQNIIDRAVIISRDAPLRLDFPDIEKDVLHNRHKKHDAPEKKSEKIMTQDQLREVEIANIVEALEKTGWKVYGKNGAAALLGMKPTTLASRVKALGIKSPDK